MKNKVENSIRGFTLVETLVAISILAISITGPMIIAQKGIGSSVYARDEITSFYLAQEAVEYIRAIRDSNRTNGAANWLTSLSTCLSGGICKVDGTQMVYSTGVTTCGASCPNLTFDSVNHFYGYGAGGNWKNTIFKRSITINETVPNVEAIVSVTVTWTSTLFSTARSFTVKEHMFNF